MSGLVSITDRVRRGDVVGEIVRHLERMVSGGRDRELLIRSRRLAELRARKPVPLHPLLPSSPQKAPSRSPDGDLIDFRPHARRRHVLRFDGSGYLLDETLTVISDYVRTADPVGVETGGFLWGLGKPNGAGTVVTRVSGPAPESRHEPHEVVLGDPCKVKIGGQTLRADLIPIGDWHSHPGSASGQPSQTDRESWVAALKRSRLPSYMGVIVHRPHKIGGWSLRAWVTYREKATGRYVVEPAAIEREG